MPKRSTANPDDRRIKATAEKLRAALVRANGEFGLALVARRRPLLPELVRAAEVQEVVAADAGLNGLGTERDECEEGLTERVRYGTVVVVKDIGTQAVLPLTS